MASPAIGFTCTIQSHNRQSAAKHPVDSAPYYQTYHNGAVVQHFWPLPRPIHLLLGNTIRPRASRLTKNQPARSDDLPFLPFRKFKGQLPCHYGHSTSSPHMSPRIAMSVKLTSPSTSRSNGLLNGSVLPASQPISSPVNARP